MPRFSGTLVEGAPVRGGRFGGTPVVAEPEAETSVMEAIAPRTTSATPRVGGDMLSAGLDVLSLPGRVLGSIAPGRGPKTGTLERMSNIEGDNLGQKIIRDPALPLTLAAGGPIASGAARLGLGGVRGLMAAGAAEGAVSAATHQADNVAAGRQIDPGSALMEIGASALLPPTLIGAGRVLKAPGKALASLGRAGEEAVPEVLGTGKIALPEPKFGIQLTPAQAARAQGKPANAMQALESFAETQPFLQGIPEEITAKNATAAQDAILATRNRAGQRVITSPDEIVPSASGARIEDAVRDAKKAIGERAGRQQDLALTVSGANVTPVPAGKAGKAIDDYLGSYGFSKKSGFRGQEGGVSEGAINFALEQKDLLANAKTTRQLLDQKRRIANQVYKGTSGMDPVFIGVDKSFLTGLERKVNDVITEQFDVALLQNQLTDGEYMDAKKLWEAGNKGYSESRKILESVDKGLGISNPRSAAEDYFSRIADIGAEDLRKIKAAATGKGSDLAPVFNEMQETFFDNLLKTSFSKGPNNTLVISPDKLATKWNAMDAGIKDVMVPKSVIDEMDALLGQIGQAEAGSAKRVNPSGTTRLSTVINTIKNPVDWVAGMLMREPIKQYYTTGALGNLPSAVNFLRTASKAGKIAGKGLAAVGSPVEFLGSNPFGRQAVRSSLFAPENDDYSLQDTLIQR